MSSPSERPIRRLPLLPLADEVHFPHTELRLHIADPEYCTLIEDLFLARGREGWVGTVLLRPDFRGGVSMTAPVFAEGTAGRLVDVTEDSDGCHVTVRGEYRFEVERETCLAPCREALVRTLDEAQVSEQDPEVKNLRLQLLETTTHLAGEMGEDFELGEHLTGLGADLPFEAVVNQMAAHVDIDPVRKLQLLRDALPDRALRLLTILRSRRQVLDVLRPYRHHAAGFELN